MKRRAKRTPLVRYASVAFPLALVVLIGAGTYTGVRLMREAGVGPIWLMGSTAVLSVNVCDVDGNCPPPVDNSGGGNTGGSTSGGGGGGGGGAPQTPAQIPANTAGQCKKSADVSGDGTVSLADFSILAYWFGRQSPPDTVDLNCDGKVNLVDFSIMAYYWEQ